MSRPLEQEAVRSIVRAEEEGNFGMDYKRIGLGLGFFSIGLGLLKLVLRERSHAGSD